ncbi:hypothetical protein [Streptomyces sp. NPDC096339]|uniref:hypothetical protein n=1 Tax=Streptomyces sp. NPDC096339 TaxID=3366086 RepID=UPI003810CBEF
MHQHTPAVPPVGHRPGPGGLGGRQLGSCVGESMNHYPNDEADRQECVDACTDTARTGSY